MVRTDRTQFHGRAAQPFRGDTVWVPILRAVCEGWDISLFACYSSFRSRLRAVHSDSISTVPCFPVVPERSEGWSTRRGNMLHADNREHRETSIFD